MPAAITHYYHAKRVWELVETNPTVREIPYLWGAQGPDFLFCHRSLPWQKGDSLASYGTRLHQESPSRIFTLLRECCRLDDDDFVRSYCMGFLCHYAADRVCHPFVHCQAGRLQKEEPEQSLEILHHQVESALDTITLRYEAALLPMEFSLKRTLPENSQVQKRVADLYAFLLEKLYDVSHTADLLFQATKDARTVFGWLNDRTSLKKSLVERWEKKHGGQFLYSCHIRPVSEGDSFDYANVLLQDWKWPEQSGTVRKGSFFDLYEQSILDAQKIITDFLAGVEPDILTENIPFE